MNERVSLTTRGNVGVITVDNPPVNAISQAVRQGLADAASAVARDTALAAVVIHCAGRTFMAGADIKEFGKPLAPPMLPDVIGAFESMDKPVVAAIHGTALGGGFEIALGCHYRVAHSSARVGLPEVHLGLIPGAGGTQRTPRLMGVAAALDLMITGRPIGANAAHERGLVDAVVHEDLLDSALAFVADLLVRGQGTRRSSAIELGADAVEDGFFTTYRAGLARRLRGYFAPERIVQSVENAVRLPFAEGLERERELFSECMASPESAGMRHVFFAEREVSKIPDVAADLPLRPIKSVAVIGAGTMGGGIAMNFANAGIPVTILEVESDGLERGLQTVRENYERTQRKGRLTQEDVVERMGLLTGTLDYADLAHVDLVIEAVFENIDIKTDVFGRLDEVCKPGAILASNTSTLDVDAIAACTKRPQDVLGLHFFSPANVMRLLEIVRGAKTAPDVLATCMRMARSIGKVGVVSGVCYGFIGNRMLEGYTREASFMLLEGAKAEQIDAAVYGFGLPMGPHAMMDLAGQDVGFKVREQRRVGGGLPNDARYGLVGDEVVRMGRHGQKTRAGVYRYEPGSRTPIPDPEIEQMIADHAARLGIVQREVDDEEIVQRCVYPLINEGARILAEGIAARPGDIDIVWINGYGFPPYRGGPMFYADTVGLRAIRDRLNEFADLLGNDHGYWTPAPLLDELADADSTFAQWSVAG